MDGAPLTKKRSVARRSAFSGATLLNEERLKLEELSRKAVAKMRSCIFQRYGEADLRIDPGSVREEYVVKRTKGRKQNLGSIHWEMTIDRVRYRVRICHDGDVFFSINVIKVEGSHVCAMVNATYRNLATKTKFAIEYALEPKQVPDWLKVRKD